MTELPDNVDLNWLGRQAITQRNNLRSMRTDMDMLIRLVTRVDSTLDAIRADLKTLWLSQSDLRRRIETLEEDERR